MDYLSIEVSPAEVTGHKHAAVGLYTVARINGRALPDILDVDAFFDALTGRGRLPLFTCDCGDFWCGGSYIDVASTDTAWIWRNRYAPGRLEHARVLGTDEHHLPWSNVRSVADELLALLQSSHRERPHVRLMSAYPGIDLCDRLPHYEAQAQAITEL